VETEELGLAEAIEAIRRELAVAQDQGRGSDVRFTVGAVELEFAVDARRTTGGEASITVLSLLSLGGKGEAAKGETHRVKVALSPLAVDGRPFEVSAAAERRPDPASP
jgi:Trypsin-co-occurring domain 2